MPQEPQAPDQLKESAREAAKREGLPARRRNDKEEESYADIYRFCLGKAKEAGFMCVMDAVEFARRAQGGPVDV